MLCADFISAGKLFPIGATQLAKQYFLMISLLITILSVLFLVNWCLAGLKWIECQCYQNAWKLCSIVLAPHLPLVFLAFSDGSFSNLSLSSYGLSFSLGINFVALCWIFSISDDCMTMHDLGTKEKKKQTLQLVFKKKRLSHFKCLMHDKSCPIDFSSVGQIVLLIF